MANSKKVKTEAVNESQLPANVAAWLPTLQSSHPLCLKSLWASLNAHGGMRAPWGIAISGGPDSAALALCAASLVHFGLPTKPARLQPNALRAPILLHVHHGLQAPADLWQDKVLALAELLGLTCHTHRVQVNLEQGTGMEAAARTARQQALQDLARELGLQRLMFAHHLHDQSETVLLRLFRGAGPGGLGAMQPANLRENCWWLRPWLDVSRHDLVSCVQGFTQATGWEHVNDPTNLDADLARGVVRKLLAEPIARHWPAWRQTLGRHAQQAQETAELLTQYGELLLTQVIMDESEQTLDLRKWRDLERAQQSLVLRTWFAQQGVKMPTQRRLAELCRQLNQIHQLGTDRNLLWRQSDCEVTCAHGSIRLRVRI